MADFKTVLLNKAALLEALSSLNVGEAMKAKSNIDEALESGVLKLPSDDLLKMLEKEGLSINDFAVSESPVATASAGRKKRQLKAEKQNFTHKDNQLVLLVSRAVSKAKDEGFTVVHYSELSSEDKVIADQLVNEYNA